jgi:putative ABC transport system substrate-binding protein
VIGARRFLGVLVLVLLSAELASAQAPRVYRVGVAHLGGPYAGAVNGLREGLRELGLEEGRQYTFLLRDAKGDVKAAEAAARELERDKVDLIYSVSTSVTIATKRGTTRVPIVFYAGSDPVASGLVESYRKPGGRLTGVHGQLTDLTAKRLELLKEIVPNLRRVVTFYNPDNPVPIVAMKFTREAARRVKIDLVERPVRSVEELRAGLLALRQGEVDALFYVGDATVFSQIDVILETARAKKLPTMFQEPAAVTQGALVAYGSSYNVAGHQSAKQVQRVLQGGAPGDLPVEQLPRPTLALNLKTAKTLGLTIPRSVVLRADEVVQ